MNNISGLCGKEMENSTKTLESDLPTVGGGGKSGKYGVNLNLNQKYGNRVLNNYSVNNRKAITPVQF